MPSQWVAVVAVGAMWQVPPGAARADLTIAQASAAEPAAPAAPPPYPAPPAPPPPYPAQPPYPAPPPYPMQPAYPMQPMPAPYAPPAPPPMAGPRVILRIDRDTARLQQQTVLGWRNVCVPPCGAVVDPRGVYRVGGSGALISEPFQLPRSSGDVYVDGHVGSKASRFVGLGLMLGGLGAAAYGSLIWASTSDNPYSSDPGRNLGVLTIAVGAVLGTIGAVMFSSAYTSVQAR